MYVAAAAAVVGAVGSLMKGQSESDALDYQAKIQANNAEMARRKATMDADRQQMIAGQKIGGITADYAASGVDVHTSGSVLSILGASASNSELDRQNILHGGDIRAINYENQSSLDRVAGGNALTGSYYGAAASLIGGAAKMYGNYSGGSSPDSEYLGQSDSDAVSGYGAGAREIGYGRTETLSASNDLGLTG